MVNNRKIIASLVILLLVNILFSSGIQSATVFLGEANPIREINEVSNSFNENNPLPTSQLKQISKHSFSIKFR